ncbi:MAG: hypothetical protein K2Z25_19335 [Beijerinckiaceae bacterium]|nr:hypothetical protein [Beijerinckiaceae bacterium]
MATQFIALFSDTAAQNAILATGETADQAISTALSNLGGDLRAEDLIAQPVTSRLGALLDTGTDVKSWANREDGRADVYRGQITDKDVETALKDAGGFYMYVLENDDTEEISVEYSPVQLNIKWSEEWTEINEIAPCEAGWAAQSKNPKAEMRTLLSRRP